LRGKNVAIQEYGESNAELPEGFWERGAYVTIARRIDVALFTTSVQVVQLFRIAEQAGKKKALRAGMEVIVKDQFLEVRLSVCRQPRRADSR
jgi:hypothetical protein